MSEERKITYAQAIKEAMVQEMQKDKDIIFIGQDISGGAGREKDGLTDTWGGSFGVSKGMSTLLGTNRVIDCPLSEAGYMGAAVSASTTGIKVISELMFNDFLWLAGDQLFNGAAKLRYLSGGTETCRLTVRTVMGGGLNAGMHHSQSLYSLAAHIPGIKVAIPSTPYDAKGMLVAAIRDENPVIIFENKALYNVEGYVPEELYTVPLGKARIAKEGSDVTIIVMSRMLYVALEAEENLKKNGISAEIIDVRSLVPLDENVIIDSVKKTGHVVIVDEALPRCSAATDLAALVADKSIDYIDGPIKTVTSKPCPVPFSPILEKEYLPSKEDIINAVYEATNREG